MWLIYTDQLHNPGMIVIRLLVYYSLRPSHFFTLSFLGFLIQFFTFQNLPKIVKESHHFSTFLSFSHYFYSTIFFLYIKNQWVPPLHPLFFLFSITLYIFLNLRAQSKR